MTPFDTDLPGGPGGPAESFGLGGTGGSRIVFDDAVAAGSAAGSGSGSGPAEPAGDAAATDRGGAATGPESRHPAGLAGGDDGPDAEELGVGMLELLAEVIDESAREALAEVLSRRENDAPPPVGEDDDERPDDGEAEDDGGLLEKLRTSANIAQRYFGRPNPGVPIAKDQPSGRPEDAGIEADLDELLAEIAALPTQPNPARQPAVQTGVDEEGIARQLLGVYLYLFMTYAEPDARNKLSTPMRRAFAVCGGVAAMLDVYLGGGDFREISNDADRLALLELACQAGRGELVLERGYVDADLVVEQFPQSMRLAAQVLGQSPTGLEILRSAIDRLVEQHGMRAFVEILRDSGLQDPEVVGALVRVGGECAHATLTAVAWTGRLELYATLVEYLQGLELPLAERRALASLRPRDPGAASYLQLLFRDAGGEVSDELRARTGELLRRQVQRIRTDGNAHELIAAIEDLALAPDARTRDLLREFGGRNRWSQLFDRLGSARAKAREVLQHIERRRP
ncbi:MAG: hypothetical protein KDE27_03030 [Planctomycetes bacterium]|nr:hypothetical protein [Planctomycetota bacterium]